MAETLVKKLGNVNLYIVEGDITQIQTPAIMTAINSEGLWFGGVDGAIQRVAGNSYHSQAAAAMPLHDLQTVVAKGNSRAHSGKFNDVVFVVDDLKSSLDKVVYKGLEAAHQEGYPKLLVPAIRMGVMAGVVEKTPKETIDRLGQGINDFMKDYGAKSKLENLTFVIYRDPKTMQQIGQGLSALPSPK